MEVSKPLIAAINGYCLAGGQELALACDIRIASDTAHFGAPEVKRGILHGYGALRLVHAIPMASAMEMLLTGEMIDAQEALRIGLVSRVVPQVQLMSTAEAIAQRICENSAVAVRAIKDLAYRGLGMPLEHGLRYYAHVNRLVHASEDAREGPRAFTEKRKADFKGR
ncbi:MAG: enoyl-CoA hydratase/isomerase family protein [Chloroflexi bacterium]|nr:enoyl-CoA hydratase/isomerase family protein [Chloroflexota bacterium]